jgi:Putative MetA-pathway of phenol degradation
MTLPSRIVKAIGPRRHDLACPHAALGTLLAAMSFVFAPANAQAQQLEPRAYSSAPVGLNFLGLASGYSNGDVLTDPSLPVENVHAIVYNAAPYYGRTFGLFGHQASVTAAWPYGWATVHGEVQDVSQQAERSGLLDPHVRFAVNLAGGPALSPREFAQRKPHATLGASVTIVAPLGQYEPAKLINLGTNRWAIKPELGFSQPVGKWTFEIYAGLWLFETNENFFGGKVRQQDPLASYQAHVVYSLRPNFWAAADYTYYAGGSSTVDGQPKNDRQGNSRGGLTISVPVMRGQSLKFAWSRGVSARVGAQFETIGIAWQYLWL